MANLGSLPELMQPASSSALAIPAQRCQTERWNGVASGAPRHEEGEVTVRRSIRSVIRVGMAAAMVVTLAGVPAGAQQRRTQLEFIRDAEIEHTIRTFARPIFDAAGIDAEAVTFVLVKDPQINAFVAGGMNMFFHTGLLQQADEPGQLVGVIAHETGHISGGHLIRGQDAMETAAAESLLSLLLGVGAAVASGNAGAAAAVITGGQELAKRQFLAFSRTQESSADQAALSSLDRAGWSARGLVVFLEKLAGQELVSTDRQSEYVRTHPLTRDRINAVKAHIERSRFSNVPVSPAFIDLHERMRAKLLGFIQPTVALRRYRENDTGIPARYARAVAYYQRNEIPTALTMIDSLIAQEPNNPYFYELKGQVLMENRRLADSLPPYRKAVELAPDEGLLRMSLAQALLETLTDSKINDAARSRNVDEAIRNLEAARNEARRAPLIWRLLGTAWSYKGDQGKISYCQAEEALARGDRSKAIFHVKRAKSELPINSPYWQRSRDIDLMLDPEQKADKADKEPKRN
ncbi:beta-barrel assembly-enhancing protease [uncultured Gammaproteobacteria bacterium]